jgi:DNA polymerase III epsilon subunit-like protein
MGLLIVVDVETSGLDEERDQVVSIGAVDFAKPQRTYYNECRLSRRVRPTQEALHITGFSLKDLRSRDKPTEREIVGQFLDWGKRSRMLAGENPWFDAAFLHRASSRYGLAWPFGHRLVDLPSVSYSTQLRLKEYAILPKRDSSLSLDKTLKFVGLEPRKTFHNALGDAKLEAEALSRLIYGKPLVDEYSKYRVPSYLKRR